MVTPGPDPHLWWTERPDYIEATNTVIQPGGPTEYLIPRQVGWTNDDVTSFHPGQASWSMYHMPDIIYVLDPPRAWNHIRYMPRPPPKLNEYGSEKKEQWPEDPLHPQTLLDFKILPDQIGTCEEWWYYEAIKRLDPRIQWPDIKMRQFKKGRIIQFTVQRKLKNEFRPSFNIRNWFRMGTERDKIISELSPIQRAANTTRGLTPGLLSPGLGEAGGRIPLPPNLTHTASSGVVKDTNFKARALQIYRADPSQPLNLLNETPGVKSSALGISEKKLESGNQVSSGEIIELSDPPSPQDPNSVSEDSESAQESLTLADSRQTSQRFLKPASRLPATPSATFPRDFRTSFGERPSTHAATNFSVSTAHSPSLENRIQTLEEAILLNQSNKGQNKETSRNFHAKSATQAWNNEWDAQMPCHSQHLMEQDNFNTQNLSERLSFEQTRNIEEISARPSHHRDDQPVLTLTPFRCDNPFLRDQQFQTEPLIKTEKPDDILASWPQHIATTTGYQQSHDRNLARTPPSGSQGLPRTPRRRRRAESSIDDPPPSPPQPPRQRRRESNTKYESVDTSAWRLPDGTFHGLPAMPPAHTRPRINLRREYETQERILNIRRALTGRDPHWEERPVRRGRLRRGLQKP